MVLFNPLHHHWALVREQALAVMDRVGQRGQWILGEAVRDFERALASQWPLPDAAGCGNGLDALVMALRAVGVGPGDAVLTTPLSAFATTLAILHVGARPVFVDVDDQGLLDLTLAERAIREHSDIRCLLPVHLYGQPMDLSRLAMLCQQRRMLLVEDCAQAIQATWNGQSVGTVGHAAAVSFYPTKNLGALGDGGAVLSADAKLVEFVRQMRDYGQTAKYVHAVQGFNSRLDELQAALLLEVFLPRLSSTTARRRAIASRYQEGLHHPRLRVLRPPPEAQAVWHLFPIFLDGDRTVFRTYLEKNEIESAVHYPHLIPDQPVMRARGSQTCGDLPRARALAQHEVSLPLHPWMSDAEVEHVIGVCNAWKP